MSATKNSVATVKQEADKKILWEKFEKYVMEHDNEVYIDYRDELSREQISKILEGAAEEVRCDIEDFASGQLDGDDYYWENMAEELGVEMWQIREWQSEEGVWPASVIDDYDWSKLLRNTPAMISATVWEATWDFYNWAYGGPVFYSDVKESLKLLGINPLDFRNKDHGWSLSGDNKLKGWFPDMPNRVPVVDMADIVPQALYNGVMNFCLGNLEDLIEVLNSDSKEITFKAGTNVVMYDFGNGAGIAEFELKKDLTIQRKKIEFRNDDAVRWGIEECYGFGQEYWNQGKVRNGGENAVATA